MGDETAEPVRDDPDTEVLVVGAGPVGLLLAAELARHGVVPRLVDRRPEPTEQSRALALSARTLELLDQLGLVDEVLTRGRRLRGVEVHTGERRVAGISFEDGGGPFPFALCLPQHQTEALLAAHGAGLGVVPERGVELVDCAPAGDGVLVTLRDRDGLRRVRAGWLVGCDGAHSAVRARSGIGDSAEDLHRRFLLADVAERGWAVADDRLQAFFAPTGVLALIPLPDPGWWRVIASATDADTPDRPVTLERITELVAERTPLRGQVERASWLSSFETVQDRAGAYRRDRVLLAGDAAHSHSPIGGQGMNTGLQDAANLAWKLARVVTGRATGALLDTYQAERQPVSATVLRSTELATRAVTVTAAAPRALRHSAVRLLSRVRPFQEQVGRTMGQLTVDYPDSPLSVERWNGPAGGPAAGDRAPDVHLRDGRGLTTLRRLTADTGHHVLVFAGDAPAGPELDALAARWRAAVEPEAGVLVVSRRPVREGADEAVVEDRSGRAHRAYGAGAGTVHLLRPDGYVAYRRHHDVEPAEVARLLRAYAPEPAPVG